MKKYRYYLLILVGVLIGTVGTINCQSNFGMILWGIGILICVVGVLLQITTPLDRTK